MATYNIYNETYEYKIPTCFVCPIEYGDMSALEETDIEELNEFLDSMPSKGHGVWSWGDENYFSYSNDVNNLGDEVIDATFVPYVEAD
jgi:hypothetical protein